MHKIKYRFSNSKKKFLKILKIIDFIGYSIFNNNKMEEVVLNDLKTITVVQLGHLGDFLLTIIFLKKLKKYFNGKIILAVNYDIYEVANLFIIKEKISDEVISIRHRSFNRTIKSNIFQTIKDFKKINSDLIFELRGDIRILPLLKIYSQYKYLLGYKCGGGGFLLTHTIKYPFNQHIIKTYLEFFNFFNITENDKGTFNLATNYSTINKKLDNIVIAIGAGAQSRDWADDNFIELINSIFKTYNNYKIVLVGKVPANRYKIYDKIDNNNLINKLNKTSIKEVFEIIETARLFIGLESGLTHYASLLNIDTIVLFSGASSVNIWKPLGKRVYLIKSNVDCEGCGLLECKDNKCMKNILVDEVLIELNKVLV